ncbi:hypothetical protein VF04_28355 [Nostoc linckia z7]|uniref:Uncharacterized protein n=1 Tax=Nostoc linckia z7 TaxID=1628745 RepID=A0ABX4KND3_NOSLI|nr:hypothetical protein VF04_28355 [Nostoc linckia z7]
MANGKVGEKVKGKREKVKGKRLKGKGKRNKFNLPLSPFPLSLSPFISPMPYLFIDVAFDATATHEPLYL